MNGHTSGAVRNALKSVSLQSQQAVPRVQCCNAGPSRFRIASPTASFHSSRKNGHPPPTLWPSPKPSGPRFGDRAGPGRGTFGSTSWIDEDPSAAPARTEREKQQARRPGGDSITSEYIRLVGADGKMQPNPVPLQEVLSSMDQRRFSLQQITSPEELEKKLAKDPNFTPIVRIFDLRAVAERKKTVQKEKAAAARQKKQQQRIETSTHKGDPHEVTLTWSTTPHDMSHKLTKATKFLLKKGSGAKVRVIIQTKAGKKFESGTPQEKDNFIKTVEEQVTGRKVDDAAEDSASTDDETRIRRNGEVTWEGGVVKARAEVEFVAV